MDSLLFQSSRDTILVVRRSDGRILDANPAATKAYGYLREELLSKLVFDLREDLSGAEAQLAQADRAGILFETMHLRKDGTLFPVEVSSQGTNIGDTRVLISIIRDISARRRAETEARSAAQFPAENPNPVMRATVDGRILYQNEAGKQFLDEMKIGEQVLPPDLLKHVSPAIVSGLKVETEVYTSTGRFLFFVLSPNIGEGYVNLYGTDITARKLSEEALRESESRFKAISEAAFDGIIIHGDGKIIDINENFAAMYGYDIPELVGKRLLDLYAEESHDIIRKKVNSGTEEPYELTAIRKDRTTFIAEVRGKNSIYKGKKVRTGTHRDVTLLRRANDEIRRTAELLSMAQRTGRVGVFDWDLVSRESNWTLEMDEIIGIKLGPGMKHRYSLWAKRVHPCDLEKIEKLFSEWINSNQEEGRWEYRLLRDGEERWISSSGRIIRSPEGRALRMIGTILDITERKRTEEELKSSREALQTANEELEAKVKKRSEKLVRTVRKLQKEIVNRHKVEKELRHRASQLRALAGELTLAEQRERKRLSGILHDHLQQMLAAAKLQVASLEELNPVSLQNSVKEIDSLLSDSIKISRNLSAELSPPILHEGGLKAGFEWLARWMEAKYGLKVTLSSQNEKFSLSEDIRVLIFESVRELLFNIVKHAGVKAANVGITEDLGMIKVEVTDMGQGFDPSKLEKLGENGGFGLFSIMERIELIGGKFSINSAPGKGACLSVWAPLADAQTERPATATRPFEHAEQILYKEPGKIRLLLVDDHPVMREGLSRLLSQEPDIQIVGQANDGVEAIEQTRKLNPDVILMDISMPKLNGIEATRIIKQQQPSSIVIGLSLYEQEDRAKEMIEAGAAKFLSKSGPSAGIKNAIRDCCRMDKFA